MDSLGHQLEAIDLDQIEQHATLLIAEGIEAIAICLMHSYANSKHEEQVAQKLSSLFPKTYLSVSSKVLPTVRFYNRVSTTVLNAYVGPVLRNYLNSLTSKLAEIGFADVLLIMQSNGGVALPKLTLELPGNTLLSGPAAGPRAAVTATSEHQRDDCILVDMGGTSFDASLVRKGQATMSAEGEIDRLRIALPMLDISTIGAGGGSIGWIDEGGLLRMGPQSAGANPGPACYGRGGDKPTCTDADLLLGYLDPTFFAGGKLPLDRQRAEKAIEQNVAKPLGLSTEQAAAGMYRVINSNMAHGVREITIKRGLDPREFVMVVAGGAGSLHACMIADELEIPTLLVPAAASILCACGMVFSDLQHDFVRSYICRLSELDHERIKKLVCEMEQEGCRQLAQEGIEQSQASIEIFLDLRYLKQYHEVTLPVSRKDLMQADTQSITKAFHHEHNRLYGYDLDEEGTDLELINVRVRTLGLTEKPVLPSLDQGSPDAQHALKNQRRAYVPEQDTFLDIPVYDGHRLLAGNIIAGPALIERVDTTIFISQNYRARVDQKGGCLLSREVSHG